MRRVLSKFFADRGTHLAAMIAYFALLWRANGQRNDVMLIASNGIGGSLAIAIGLVGAAPWIDVKVAVRPGVA